MSMINEKEFKELANFKNDTCVSIFIPTQRRGKEVLEQKNLKHLHSLWTEASKKLSAQGIEKSELDTMSKKFEELLDDKDFWRHQSDGLAVFAAPDYFKTFSLPVNFEAYTYISEEFYVKPLIPAMNGDGKFHVLSLQISDVQLYEASKYSITPIDIDDLTPSELEERVGYDYKEKALQFRTQGAGGEKTQFHGHGGSDRDEKDEIKQFFRAVDQGLQNYLNKEKLPLIVYCQDYLFSIYKEANTYNHLVDEVIDGNPNDSDLLGVHEKSLKIAEKFLDKDRDSKLEKYKEQSQTENTSSAPSDIMSAIHQGRIDTLFVENRAEIWGTYDEDQMKTEIDDEQTSENTSLMNLAAKKTIEMGGNVYLIQDYLMPEKESKMNALFRF